MYTLSEQQIDHILNDIKLRGVEMEDLQLNLLDHICCIIESELDQGGDFRSFYEKTISKFFKKELKEIEEETIYLLTFKNYYAMKKTMIVSGIISVTAFIFGSFFKIMHWPGAGVLLVLGIGLFSILFLPLMFILKTKDTVSKRDKLITGISTLIGMLVCVSVLFAIMHWPTGGRGVLWLSAIAITVFVLIPVYFFTGIRNPDTRTNTIVTSIVLIGASGLLFAMVNVRPSMRLTEIKMYNYIQNEELLKRLETRSDYSNEMIAGINTHCEQIKAMILNTFLDQPTMPKDFEAKGILMEEGNLGQEFFENGKGIQLMKELKTEITTYNATVSAEKKIPLEHSILDIDFTKIFTYSNYAVLNSINQMQLFLVSAELK